MPWRLKQDWLSMNNFSENHELRLLSCQFEIQFCGWMTGIYPWTQYNLHTPFWRLFYNTNEGGIIESAAGVLRMQPNRFYLLPAYYEFSTHAEKPFKQFFIHFNFIDSLKVTGSQIYEIAADELIEEHIQEFIRLYEKYENRVRCEMIAHVVLGHVLLHCSENLKIKELPLDPRINACLKYIAEHLDEKLDNSTLAGYCGMARNAFIRLFSSSLSESPQAFVRRRKIEKACYLLHFSNLSLKEIAVELGFPDQYCFSKCFAKLQHNTPSRFRKSHMSFHNDYGY